MVPLESGVPCAVRRRMRRRLRACTARRSTCGKTARLWRRSRETLSSAVTDQKTPVREPRKKEEDVTRPPLPPFTRETAIQKVRLAEDGWNSRDPEKVALAYTTDSRWRNRAEFPTGRAEIVQFLKRKWAKELNYRL